MWFEGILSEGDIFKAITNYYNAGNKSSHLHFLLLGQLGQVLCDLYFFLFGVFRLLSSWLEWLSTPIQDSDSNNLIES